MKTIYKFPLVITDRQQVRLPPNANILSVKEQNGTLCLWAMVDSDMPTFAVRDIAIVGTGNPLPPYIRTAVFIDTVVMQTSPFVWHVFEVTQ